MKILNRIVVFLLSLSVFPIVYFRVIVRALLSVAKGSSAYILLSTFMKDTIDSIMEIEISLQDITGYFRNGSFSLGGMDFDFSKLPKELLITKNYLIAAGVLILISLVIAIIIMGCSLFAEAHKTVLCLSAGAFACVISAMKCFSLFAAPFVKGTIDVGKLLGGALVGEETGFLGSLGASFLTGAIEVDGLQIGNFAITLAIVFFVICMWTLAYILTMPKDGSKKIKAPKAKAAK